MTDATNFFHNISAEDLPNLAIRLFDEIMILYNLIGYRKGVTIYTAPDSASLATFILVIESIDGTSDVDRVRALVDEFDNSDFSVYGKTFNIGMKLLSAGSSVEVTISKATS